MIVTRKKTDPKLEEDGHLWSQLKDGVQYRIIGVEDLWFRIQTSSHNWKPYLYPFSLFDVIEGTVEPEWVVEVGFDFLGESYTYIGFHEFQEPGFWEDVHDDKSDTHQILAPIFDRLGLSHPL